MNIDVKKCRGEAGPFIHTHQRKQAVKKLGGGLQAKLKVGFANKAKSAGGI